MQRGGPKPTGGAHLRVNRPHWDSRVPFHAASSEYGLDRFVGDPHHLSDVVRFDLPRLGDIRGLRTVHLQCHIGTDTVSLSRLGTVGTTGLDFSRPALEVARHRAGLLGADITYVESDVYDAVEALGTGHFDLVYTGIGALCWLPDIERWAGVAAALLAPGGRLFIREGHPMLWAMDEPRADGLVAAEYPYFETPGGTPFVTTKTYVEHEGELASPEEITWNHSLGEIITALMARGMTLTAFEEHDTVPWAALGEQMERLGDGEYRLRDRPERLAASYTLQAVKS